jgi:signal transduction histidine kinase
MQRPWQVWLWFALSLAAVVPAMAWLTQQALKLDYQVTRSGREADLEEDISLALWRMDAALAPLVAQEAARPYVVYRPFLGDPRATEKPVAEAQVSPLIVQPSEFVRLHFELAADGTLTSPQVPEGDLQELAIHNGASLANIQLSCASLNQLSESIQHEELVKQLPQEQLPPFEATQLAWDNRSSLAYFNPVDNGESFNQQVLKQNDEQLAGLYRYAPNQSPQSFPEEIQSEAVTQQGEAPPQPVPPQFANNSRQEPAQQQGQSRWNEQYEGNLYGYGRSQRAVVERGELEFQRRNKALQTYANTEVVKQRNNLPIEPPLEKISEGVSAPLWVGDELLLARRVKVDDRDVVQGCWFDWPKLKNYLIAEGVGDGAIAAASLPDIDLRPIRGDAVVSPARRLATLPVEIVVPTPDIIAAPLSPIRLSLWIAWGCLGLATLCVAILLQGVVTLSERRGAFVSAVTHELRTPLTTFRMYAEMLSTGMVRDPQQQQQYTSTLRIEADRLSHLVENVLAYARLERGKCGGRREAIPLGRLIERAQSRLDDRAVQAAMTLAVDVPEELHDVMLSTDPQAVEQILFNLVDNACKYAQSARDRTIRLSAAAESNAISLCICDGGPGISSDVAKSLFQPFSKSCEQAAITAPGVGLGLALCKRLARELGGSLVLVQSTAAGATFCLTLPRA